MLSGHPKTTQKLILNVCDQYMTFWHFHFLKTFQRFSFVFRIWHFGSSKNLCQKVVHELSPTPTKIFVLDFFLRKDKLKLNLAKLLFFRKNVFIIEKKYDFGCRVIQNFGIFDTCSNACPQISLVFDNTNVSPKK